MIETLSVRDLAVVEKAEITFSNGFNTITGETGAGKSVLIGAIGLLSGAKAERSLVRSGASMAQVRATIRIAPAIEAFLSPLLEEAGIDPCEDGILLLSRTVQAAGTGGRCSINNCAASVQLLKRIGVHLVDMHGPHDNQSLLDPLFQLRALDSFGDCAAEKTLYEAQWNEIRRLEAQRDELSGDSENINREIDLLRYQVNEITEAQLDIERDGEELLREYNAASNASRIQELGSAACQAIAEGEQNAVDTLAVAVRALEEMVQLSQSDAGDWLDELRQHAMGLGELSRTISSTLSETDSSPEHLAELETRISLVEKLRHKYGRTIPDILQFLEKSSTRLDALEGRGETLAAIEEELTMARSAAKKAAAVLHEKRAQAAIALGKAVVSQLRDLGLERAAFEVSVAECEELRPTGGDDVHFDFAPNPGEPMRELRSIASSGEISRVMLALKTVLAAHDLIPILVFDEIDANVGGEIARTIGSKLKQLGDTHQVLCITHLPQVASCGERHFAVRKEVRNDRTFTSINPLSHEERINEISRMLGGASLTSVTRTHAIELLEG